jgi:flagellar motor switch protein FliG
MAAAPGDDVAVVLLRALPAEVGELILARLDADTAGRLRLRLQAAPPEPPAGQELDAALAEFFDLQRIMGRSRSAAETPGSAGDYRPVAGSGPASPAGTPPEAVADAVEDLKSLPPDRLARALEGEQPGAIALVLSTLEPTVAGQVMRRLSTDVRADAAVRLTKLGTPNPALLQKLTRGLADKARRLADQPAAPTQDELVDNLAAMIRALPRTERTPVIERLQAADPGLAARVLEKLYRIEDLVKIPDRQLQGLLSELDVKTIAVALKNVDPAVRGKVTANMSSRSRAVLDEESELLGDVPSSKVRDAQNTVLALVRKGEEEGKIVIEE